MPCRCIAGLWRSGRATCWRRRKPNTTNQQNSTFIKGTQPDFIVLVHGEKTQMRRLKEALETDMRKGAWPGEHKPAIAMPENVARVRLRFRKNIVAEVVGGASLAMRKSLEEGRTAGGAGEGTAIPSRTLVVTENFQSVVVSAEEVAHYTNCRFGSIREKFVIPIPKDILAFLVQAIGSSPLNSAFDRLDSLVLKALEGHLSAIYRSIDNDERNQTLLLEKLVLLAPCYPTSSTEELSQLGYGRVGGFVTGVEISWTASILADMIADSTAAMVTEFFSIPNFLRMNLERIAPTATDILKEEKTAAVKGEGGGLDYEKILEKMRRGEINPSQKLPLPATALPNQAEQLKQLKEKLEKSIFQQHFSLISLNHDKNKLILRGQPGVGYQLDEAILQIRTSPLPSSTACLEAFAFILFDPKAVGEQKHHAVIASDDEAFQRIVSFIFRQLV